MRWVTLWRTIGWLLVAGVAVASLAPAATLPATGISDKAAHALIYGVLTVWFRGVYRDRAGVAVGMALFAFGALLEALQALTPTRSMEVADLIANTAGILGGLALASAGLDRWCAMVESLLSADR